MVVTPEQRSCCVAWGSHYYATLDFAVPYLSGAPHDQDQQGFIPLPVGWEITANEDYAITNVLSKHPWACQALVLADGSCIQTKGVGEAGRKVGSNSLKVRHGAYGIEECKTNYLRISIRHYYHKESNAHRDVLISLKKRKFTDCMVICNQEETPCHRVVLASASPVFEKMLRTDMKEGLENRISVGEAEPKAVRGMVDSIYQGSMDVEDSKDVPAVMALAHRYECTWLAIQCAESMVNAVDADTIKDVIQRLRTVRQEPTFGEVWKKFIAKVKGREDLIVHMMDNF